MTVLTIALTALLALLGWARHALPGVSSLGEAPGPRGAVTYVFGQLRRPGDASSFVRDRRWSRITRGAGRAHQVYLVVVPPELPPDFVREPRAIEAAQGEGRLFVIDTLRSVPAERAQAFEPACLMSDGTVC